MCAHIVRLEPVGVEFEAEPGETLLNAAFRQGIALPHGCKEGQCSACKCILTDGDVDMLRYSTFALNDGEKDSGHILLCRARAYSDLAVELLNYDEELLSRSIAVKTFRGGITRIARLTHDIRKIEIELEAPLKFWAGQYVDITVTTQAGETITRSFSMANPPSKPKSSNSSSRNIQKESSPASSTPEASSSAPPSASSVPTEPASDERDATDR